MEARATIGEEPNLPNYSPPNARGPRRLPFRSHRSSTDQHGGVRGTLPGEREKTPTDLGDSTSTVMVLPDCKRGHKQQFPAGTQHPYRER